MEAFSWSEDPRSYGAGNTVALPETSMEVMADGSLEAYLPRDLRFKDGQAIRPVCPFLELYAQFTDPGCDTYDVPLTPAILEELGLSLPLLSFKIEAVNRKAARRTGDEACAFEAREMIRGDDHVPRQLLAYTHAPSSTPLVFPEHPVPLGRFQVARPSAPGTNRLGVALDTIRVRFTPGRGEVYGPPMANTGETDGSRSKHTIVPAGNRFLNPGSAWARFSFSTPPVIQVQPGATYDGESDIDRGNLSWGVVDDTCEAAITATLLVNDLSLTATARILVGPPHYAPDRRPFYSLSDELADRDPDSMPDLESVGSEELGEAVQDLFRRILETASCINVERQRNRAKDDNTFLLPAEVLSDPPPGFPQMGTGSMTQTDRIDGHRLLSDFAEDLLAGPAGTDVRDSPPMVRWEIAREQHQRFAELDYLNSFLLANEERFRDIVRPPYASFSQLSEHPRDGDPYSPRDPRIPRDIAHDMRMPSYMRDSDLTALSLTRRQWEMIDRYLTLLKKQQKDNAQRLPESSPTARHVSRVTSRRRT